MMTRRESFLKVLVAPLAAVAPRREVREPLERVNAYDVMTSRSINQIIDRVEELERDA